MITLEKKQAVIADLQADKKDTGSSAVQVGILTSRIAEVTKSPQNAQKGPHGPPRAATDGWPASPPTTLHIPKKTAKNTWSSLKSSASVGSSLTFLF